MRRPSPLTRALRCLTALVTVWCLGCGAFDPLLASLLPAGGGPMMVCASEATATSAAVAGAEGQDRSLVAVSEASDGGASCDCGSCHAPAPTAVALTPAPIPVPQLPETAPIPVLVADRAPLVPPPQTGA